MVVGAGFAGLAVASHLQSAGVDVLVLESNGSVGGKVQPVTVAGCRLDAGADAWLDRDDAVRVLVNRAGLADDVIGIASSGVLLWGSRGLHPMPPTAYMGLPRDVRALRSLLGARAAARAALERFVPLRELDDDVSVGEYVTRRFGRAVATELVDPLLGGVHAGHVDRLSLRATIPALAELAGTTTLAAAMAAQPRAAPAFLTLEGGLHRLPLALGNTLGDRLRLHADVRSIGPDPNGWVVHTHDDLIRARRVVVAAPAGRAAELVAPLDDGAAALAAGVEYASVGVVVLAFAPEGGWTMPDGTGMLVARSAGRFIKAATWVSQKWGRRVGEEPLLVRASVGRIDDQRHVDMPDEAVVEGVVADLRDAVGLPAPIDATVVRWNASLPQYDVGHLERVASLRQRLAASAPGLHVMGAAWDGVGIGPLATRARDLARDLAS